MFARRVSNFPNPHAKPRSKRGLATLRVYNPAPWPAGGIYDEVVVGAYKMRGSADPVIVIKGVDSDDLKLCEVSSKTGYARHAGDFPESLRARFEKAAAGETFFDRSLGMVKLDTPEIAAVVYRWPVWHAEKLAPDQLPAQEPAPAIPLGAKMFHRSQFAPAEPPAPPPRCRGFCPDMFDEDLEKDAPSMG